LLYTLVDAEKKQQMKGKNSPMNSTINVSVQPNIVKRLWKQWFTLHSTDRNQRFRERTIRGMVPILAFMVAAGSILVTFGNEPQALPILAGMGIVVLAAALAIGTRRLDLAAFLLFLFPVVAAIGSLLSSGYLSTAGIVMSYFAVVFGAIILPRRVTIFLPIGMIVIYGLLAFNVGQNGPLPEVPDPRLPGPFSQTMEVAILSTLFFGIGYYLLNEFENRREELASLVATLEDRVAVRTRDLTIAAKVSQQITQVLDLERLLPELTELTRANFDLYHVSIFLFDEPKHALHLQSGTGSAGRQMAGTGKQFSLTDRGLVPLAARELKPQIINDIAISDDYLPNPVLPETRSEAALPITIGQQLLGVLDLQSAQINKFSDEDIKVLTTLAEQIAIAVRNAQLFAEAHQARQEAEQANRVKSQFLASMSHELRTPLNAILNFTQFVSSGMLGTVNDEQVDTLGKVVYSGQHLLGLINDVLDISKIEAGALKLFIEPNVDLAQEARIVTDSARTLVGQKPVEIQLEIAPNLPHIVGDKRRIRQIMLNLVSNACKFTDKGSIRITLEAQQDNIVFAVHDTGAGIAPEDQGMIFELFRQSQTGLRQGEGTGLGLPISRRLAVAHGGSVWLESALGQGSTFYVSLPVHSTVLQIDEMPLEEIKHGV